LSVILIVDFLFFVCLSIHVSLCPCRSCYKR
jgi:hypothetical protein